MKSGANVPSYSGGGAAAWWIRSRTLKDVAEGPWFLLYLASLTPVSAFNFLRSSRSLFYVLDNLNT